MAISRMFVDPGDTVILEEFCYAGAINDPSVLGPILSVSPPMMTGMRMDVLASTLEWAEVKGRHAEIHLHDPDDTKSIGQYPAAGASAADAGAGEAVWRADI